MVHAHEDEAEKVTKRALAIGDPVCVKTGHGWKGSKRGSIDGIEPSNEKPYIIRYPGGGWSRVKAKHLRHLEPRLDSSSKSAIADGIGIDEKDVMFVLFLCYSSSVFSVWWFPDCRL